MITTLKFSVNPILKGNTVVEFLKASGEDLFNYNDESYRAHVNILEKSKTKAGNLFI